MSISSEINTGNNSSLEDNPVKDSISADIGSVTAVNTVTEQPLTSQTAATVNLDGSNGLMEWVGIGLSICVGIIVWRLYNRLSEDIRKLQKRLDNQEEDTRQTLDKTIDSLSNEIKELQVSVDSMSCKNYVPDVEPRMENDSPVWDTKEIAKDTERIKVRYATLQSPDENGVLRFSERSMVEEPSSRKMFIIEIDSQNGIGTYRINPAATGLILDDLQMFHDFVKPFTFSGNLKNAIIQDKTPGKIIRHGNYWIVDELLEITIN